MKDKLGFITKKRVGIAAGALALVALVFQVTGASDVIDLPSWANVPGVDLPIVGDKDVFDCRLTIADADSDPIKVQITLVDGNADYYPNYGFVWNNGNLVDDTMYERPSDDVLIVPVQDPTANEQFFSVSSEPVRDGRVYCESIMIG